MNYPFKEELPCNLDLHLTDFTAEQSQSPDRVSAAAMGGSEPAVILRGNIDTT